MDLTRTRVDRLWFIEAAIRKGGYPNATTLARDWAKHIGSGRPLDRQTIQRDIDYLRDFFHAPIEFSRHDNGFHLADRTWAMPRMRLNEGELLALLLARQMGKMYDGTPVEKLLTGLFAKLRDALAGQADVDPLLFGQQFSFHHHPARPVRPKIWADIFQGIRERQVLRLIYSRPPGGEASEREVEPVHLANVEDDWYLVGYCLASGDWRHFSVSRIAKTKVRNRVFEPRAGFDAKGYFANRFGKFVARPGTAMPEVVIRFARAAAPWVRERIWHPKQKLKENRRSGEITLTLPIPSLMEARRFCLGWGKQATVLAPAELRREMRAEAEAMAAAYAT